MGATRVAQVFSCWPHLHDRPFRLLVHMALTVKDSTPEPTYWGGRDAMADMLGATGTQRARYQTVKRAIQQLVEAGAIELKYHGHAGKRSEYLLTLDNFPREKGDENRTPTGKERGTENDPQRGTASESKGVRPASQRGSLTVPPRNKRSNEEHGEDEKSPTKVTTSSAPDERAAKRESRLALVRARADREASSA